MGDVSAITAESMAHRVRQGLQLFAVGITPAALAEATGIERRTVDAHRLGESCRCVSRLLRCAMVLPAGFLGHVVAPAGFAVWRTDLAAAISAPQTLAEMSGRLHLLATALADGVLDHRERAQLAPEMRQLGSLLASFADQLEGGRT
ncbi:MAG: hypothetical protein GC191_08000 [Azospirillum sp.]|nr:hypothetical protein [Azospirillum sp.]